MRRDLAILCWCSLLLIGFSSFASAYKKQSSQVEEAASEDGPFVLHPAMQQINPEIKGLAGYQDDLPKKNTWPELVGKDATEVKELLEKETDLNVFLVPTGSAVTMDYRTNRVRVSFDPATNKVVKAPRVG
ncbi:TPA: hypothetical protein ACH3X3_014700 [Trebouxia sp. C0006]